MTVSSLLPQYQKLIAAAKKVRHFAYAPYSGYKVGAAVLTQNRKIFTGCNVENASYGLSNCAERVALAKAISEGEKKIIAIAVVTGSVQPASPCGACRQAILEFGKNILILMVSSKGKVFLKRISYLLPDGFDNSYLRRQEASLQGQSHSLGEIRRGTTQSHLGGDEVSLSSFRARPLGKE